jgi:hypothetical protein
MSVDQQKKLRKFIERRHPLYSGMLAHWAFLEETYAGGRGWFANNIFQYIKEGPIEFKDRVERAYRFNHTREVVDLVDKYLFKMELARNVAEAPDSVKKFWKRSTQQGHSIKEFAKTVSKGASTYGRVWVVVDSTKTQESVTVADAKDDVTYAYMLEPQHVLDMSYDELGDLNWVLIHEVVRDDADPIESTGSTSSRYRLWTRSYYQVFTIRKEGTKSIVVPGPETPHELGRVPVIAVDNVISDEKYTSPSMIADVAYLDRACANYLSNLDAIIQDQTFSQLAMPAQGLTPGDDSYAKLLEMGTKRIFTYDGESGSQPFFLSPDPRQAELILKVINKIINEIYHSIGLAGERTKEDNSQGIDNSSGVAKAYDFERVNSLLAAKADALELFENQLCELVANWGGEEETVEKLERPLVQYPDNFDVRGLYDEFEIAARLALVEAPDLMRREQMTLVIDKLFPQLKKDLRESMVSELKSWPLKIDPLAPAGSGGVQAIKKTSSNALSNKLVKGNAGKV